METKIKNAMPLTIMQEKRNLTKHIQDLYTEDYKTPRKESKDLNE